MTILDYNEEQLKQLDTETLKKYLDECQYYEEQFNTSQLVKKILINSLYGAIGNSAFPLFNLFIASAITSNGRFFIQKLGQYMENTLQKYIPSNNKYLVYGDTDSTVGDTQIIVNNCVSPSVNQNLELENNNINYVSKHKVKKRFYKITVNGKEVTITEDHSLIVLRKNKLIACKVSEIKKGDKLCIKNSNCKTVI